MKYKITLLIALFFSISTVFAQKNTVQLVSSNDSETVLTFKIESHDFKNVNTPNGVEKVLVAENTTAILQKGFPDLPKFTESIIIPDFGKTKVEIVSSNFYEIENVDIAPSKGNFTRDIDPTTIPYEYGKTYKKDEFFPTQIASTNNPYIARDYRGQAIHVYPFTYNAVKNILRVYTDITVKITSTEEKGINEFKRTKSFTKVAKEFKNIYSNHFINYSSQTKYTPVEEEGNMLVICYDDWTAEMQPLVDWKNTIGRPCEMVTVTEAGGSSSAIATYVENYYNDNGLTYLLLVGDALQVPTLSSNGDSDNAYAYITGSDHYLEFFVGRFSAENAAHVSTQVQRTITYENGSTLEDGWLNIATGIASSEGPGDDNEYDYAHARNMLTDLLTFTYVTPTYEIFDGTQGGNDSAGDATPAQVANALNSGTGLITYTGHGDVTYWVSSGFDTGDINSLTNENKLPFIFDVACVNGAFDGATCFGEAWLRAENNGQPTGAIAIVASTINQSWAPPMNAQDEMVDLIVGASTNGTKRTFTGIAVNGMFLMNDEDNDVAMTDTWTTFGDPSVMIRTDNTSDMVITHNPTILVGQSEFVVNCDFDGGFACLSKDGIILGTATVSGGVANVPVGSVTPGDELTIAITGFNKVTYLETITVIAPTGPYIVVGGFEINGGNSINYSQSGNINITLKNVGPEEATSVTATLTTTDEYVTSLSNSTDVSFGTIAGDNGTAVSSGSFSITVANNVPDQHIISFDILITDASKATYEGTINLTANAPALSIGDLTISNDDNADGILDPGETADLTITCTNDGNADVTNVISAISSVSTDLTINTATAIVVPLAVGETENFVFNVTADAGTGLGTPATITNDVTAGASNQYTATKDFEIIIGFVPEYCTSGATNSGDTEIQQVYFGNVANITTGECGQYNDYTENESLTAEFVIGSINDISFFLGNCDAGSYTKAGKVYIDWNYDGDFDDADEMVFETAALNQNWLAEGSFTVPLTANTGQKFMRIVISEDETNINPCGTYSYGETEDYKIYLVDPTTPEADFSATPLAATVGMSVSFTDETINYPSAWSWSITPGTEGVEYTYVNGTDATSQNPEVRFDVANSYTIALTASNTAGSDVETKTDYIVISDVSTAPVANFEADLTSTVTGGLVNFTDLSTQSPNAWAWTITPGTEGVDFEFVNTTSSASQNPSVQFNTPGNYSIELVATNGMGNSAPELKTDYIEVIGVYNMQNATITTCSGMFYDTGGATGTYQSNEDLTMTFLPGEAGKMMNIEFVEFATEGGYDYLSVYDATDASNLIGQYDEDDMPPTNITATNVEGALTFVFTSDGSVTRDGWVANMTCVDAVGVANLSNEISIYPNPTSGTFSVNLSAFNGKKTKIEITSVSGQTIYSNETTSEMHKIDLSNNAKGVYFVKITSGNNVFTNKIMIK